MPRPHHAPTPDEPGHRLERRDTRRQLAAYLDGIVDHVADDSPVPITVWRAVAADDPHPTAPGRLTPWLARRLLATYTRRGGTVVDLDADPPLRHAATASGRGYLPVTRPADLAKLDDSGDVDLITMRWPRPRPVPATAVVDLFHACRLVLGRQGHTAVIVDPPPGTPYLEFGHQLVPAASQAGMGYLQHIIAVLAPIVGDTSTASTPERQAHQVAAANGIHVKIQLDMLIFVVIGGFPTSATELTDTDPQPDGGLPRLHPTHPRSAV